MNFPYKGLVVIVMQLAYYINPKYPVMLLSENQQI
jgi:hypothetical protein